MANRRDSQAQGRDRGAELLLGRSASACGRRDSGGLSAGKVSVNDFSIVKLIDTKLTAADGEDAATGEHISSASASRWSDKGGEKPSRST